MRNTIILTLFSLIAGVSGKTFAQAAGPTAPERIVVDPIKKPFYHGVASGDPMPDKMMIWTRVTPDSGDGGPIKINWQIATDRNFTHVVNYGYDYTDVSKDYTFKTDVCGLQPNTYYYYMFSAMGRNSIIGRTKTAPSGDNDSVRFAVVSCASYEHGYYHAYEDISNRNDVDAVIHLGDYIYEYETGGFSAGLPDRVYEPLNEIITLSDYRVRHSHIKLDADLMRLHQLQPFITEWDDHETANDSYRDGAQNHTSSTEGPWDVRKHNGVQAYNEWMPFRKPDITDTIRIWRKLRYGKLLDLILTDSRLYDRDLQDLARTNDPTHKMLGRLQMDWLKTQFSDTTSRYKIWCNQVMFAPLQVFGTPVNADQWDGYNTDRQEIENHLRTNNIKDVVILTGDIHTSWANDVPGPGYVSSSGAGSICPEFVGTSVTSTNFNLPVPAALLQTLNPHMKYINLSGHGYMIFDVNKTRTQTDYIYISNVETHPYTVSREASFTKQFGQTYLRSTSTGLSGHVITAPNPPMFPDNSITMTRPSDSVYVRLMENTPVTTCVLPAVVSCPGYSVSILDSTNYGSLTLTDSCIRYVPLHNYSGMDTAWLLICQANPYYCDTVPVYYEIQGFINRSYVLVTIPQDSSFTRCTSYDDLFTATASSGTALHAAHGTDSLYSDSCLHYAPFAGYNGQDTVLIYACDNSTPVKCDTVVFIITVKPRFSRQYVYANIDQDSILDICKGFDELAAPYASSSIVYSTGHGFATLNSDTCLHFAPSVTFTGNDTLIVVACHGGTPLRCDTVVYVINVDPVNNIRNLEDMVVFGVNPNPFNESLLIQYYAHHKSVMTLKLTDMSGKVLILESFDTTPGLRYAQIKGDGLADGSYLLTIENGRERYTKTVIKTH